MTSKRGQIWRIVRNSPGIQISLYFIAFAMLIGLYTFIILELYPILEGRPITGANALLFVVESMTTVGNSELPRFTNPYTMLLSIQIILSGVIMIFIVVPLLIAPFLTALLAPIPPKKTSHKLSGHTVVVGYDELTRSVIDALTISDHDILIIERDKALALEIATHYRKRAYVIWGEYTDPGTWDAAYLEDAGYILIAKDERMTANIILGIRERTKGQIISVVDKLSFDTYLTYAGADYVLSPKDATGRILARHAVLNPAGDSVPDIPGLDRITINLHYQAGRELRLINIPVVPGCKAIGKRLQDLDIPGTYGVTPLFLWKSGTFVTQPEPGLIVDDTTSVFLFGPAESIARVIHDIFSDGKRGTRAVIAGFGDVGKAAYHDLRASGISCKIVDSHDHGLDKVIGNAEDEQVLRDAGIQDAQFCIVALNDDSVNIFTTLMARNLNPAIRILSRANEPASADKLYRAGADFVALLPTIGAQTIGRIVLSASMTVLVDLPDGTIVVMKQVTTQHPVSVGRYGKKTGIRIIGIESATRTIVLPGAGEILLEGDAVIAVGTTEQLKKFLHLI